MLMGNGQMDALGTFWSVGWGTKSDLHLQALWRINPAFPLSHEMLRFQRRYLPQRNDDIVLDDIDASSVGRTTRWGVICRPLP